MSRVVGWVLIGLLAALGWAECRRFGRAARAGSNELPYPRRRLVRRLTIGALLAGCIGLLMFWPRARWAVQAACLGGVLVATLVALGLIWRDLYETSTQAVAHSQRLQREAGESLQRWFDEQRTKRRPKP